jgi:hypothetical protein
VAQTLGGATAGGNRVGDEVTDGAAGDDHPAGEATPRDY